MSAGFKVWNLLPSGTFPNHPEYLTDHEFAHIPGAIITAALFIGAGIVYRMTTPKSRTSAKALSETTEEELVPAENVSSRNILESLGEYVRDRVRDIIGEDYVKFLPLLSFVFLWVLVNNLIGMVPGFGSPTDNINTTLSMGIFIFIYYNVMGIKSHGFHYIEQFMGHLPGFLLYTMGLLLLPLELISHMIRPMTLGMRLRTNIYADHTVYETIAGLSHKFGEFLGEKMGTVGHWLGYLFSALAPVPIVVLGILVCVIQALVFTLLSSVYISIATAHEEH